MTSQEKTKIYKAKIKELDSVTDSHVKRILLNELKRNNIGQTTGQGIGGIIGAIVGIALAPFTGGASLMASIGFIMGVASVGAAIGGIIDPPKVPDFGDLNGYAGASPTYGFGELKQTLTNQLPVAVMYGYLKVAGNIIWQSDPSTSVDRIQVICEGEIESISNVRINDIAIGDITGCSVSTYTGTIDQTVNSRATGYVSGLKRSAYLALTLQSGEQLKGGNPTTTCNVEGLKVRNWNSTSNIFNSYKTYSRNPADCIRDFLTNSIYGVGIPDSWIDDSTFGEVAEYCDEVVSDGSGGTEVKFRLDFSIDTRRPALDILNDMLGTFGGYMTVCGEKIKLHVERGSEIAVQSLTMDNIIEGSFGYSLIQKDDLPNRFLVQYIDPNQEWQRIEALDEDKVDQDERAALQLGQAIVEKKISLLGITRFTQASRMARRYLRLAKYSSTMCAVKVGIASLFCEVGDVVTISHDVPGWTSKPFRILAIQESEKDVMQLALREYTSSIYDDQLGATVTKGDYGHIANPFAPVTNVSSLSISETGYVDADGTYMPEIVATWDAPTDDTINYLGQYVIYTKRDTGSFIEVARADASTTTVTLRPIEAGHDWQIRVRTLSTENILSTGTDSNTLSIAGQEVAPATPSSFSNTFTDEIIFTWDANSEADVIEYEIRKADANWGTVNSNFVWRGDALRYTLVTPSARSGVTYYIKAKNRSGLYSVTAANTTPTNAAPSAPTITTDIFFELAYLTWSDVSDADLKYYEVYKSYDNNWAGEETLFQKIQGTRVLIYDEGQDGIVDSIATNNTITSNDAAIIAQSDDFYIGSSLYLKSGDDLGSAYVISAFSVAGGIATIVVTGTFATDPSVDDTFRIVPKMYFKVRGVDTLGEGTFSSSATIDFAIWSISGFQIDTNTITTTEIKDNAITSPKIIANAVVATKISVSNVFSTHISVANIAGICANLGSITAGDILGLNIRTATSGERAQLNSSGFYAFDSTSCCCSYLSAGALRFTEKLADGCCVDMPYAKRMCSGSANSGSTVTLLHWRSAPEVILGVKQLRSYDCSCTGCQQWCVYADSPQYFCTDACCFGYTFDVHSELTVESASCTQAVAAAFAACFNTCSNITCSITVCNALQHWCHPATSGNYFYGILCYSIRYRCLGSGTWCCCCYEYAQPHASSAEITTTAYTSDTIALPCCACWEVSIIERGVSYTDSSIAWATMCSCIIANSCNGTTYCLYNTYAQYSGGHTSVLSLLFPEAPVDLATAVCSNICVCCAAIYICGSGNWGQNKSGALECVCSCMTTFVGEGGCTSSTTCCNTIIRDSATYLTSVGYKMSWCSDPGYVNGTHCLTQWCAYQYFCYWPTGAAATCCYQCVHEMTSLLGAQVTLDSAGIVNWLAIAYS